MAHDINVNFTSDKKYRLDIVLYLLYEKTIKRMIVPSE